MQGGPNKIVIASSMPVIVLVRNWLQSDSVTITVLFDGRTAYAHFAYSQSSPFPEQRPHAVRQYPPAVRWMPVDAPIQSGAYHNDYAARPAHSHQLLDPFPRHGHMLHALAGNDHVIGIVVYRPAVVRLADDVHVRTCSDVHSLVQQPLRLTHVPIAAVDIVGADIEHVVRDVAGVLGNKRFHQLHAALVHSTYLLFNQAGSTRLTAFRCFPYWP